MRSIILGLVAAVALGACGGSRELLPEHEVDLFEFGIETAAEWGNAAPVTVRNSGEFPHTLVVSRDDGEVVFASDVIAAGDSAVVRLDLEPGEYELSCRLVAQTSDGVLVDHFEEGMRADLVVVE